MSRLRVVVNLEESDLRSLVVLGKLDLNNPGDQIRAAVSRYIESRLAEVERGLQEITQGEIETLRGLFDRSE